MEAASDLALTRYCFTSKLYCRSQSSSYCPPPPHLQSLPCCNTIARPSRSIRPPHRPSFVCYTPYNIGDGSIVHRSPSRKAASWTAQAAASLLTVRITIQEPTTAAANANRALRRINHTTACAGTPTAARRADVGQLQTANADVCNHLG